MRYNNNPHNLEDGDSFCGCCGSYVEYSVANRTPISEKRGIRLLINNTSRKEWTFVKLVKKPDFWMKAEKLFSKHTVVSNITTRNGPITVVVRTQ
jgi:hypothetical protein